MDVFDLHINFCLHLTFPKDVITIRILSPFSDHVDLSNLNRGIEAIVNFLVSFTIH